MCICLENTRGKTESSRPFTSPSLPTHLLLIPPILHFHYYASASGTAASSVIPPTSASHPLPAHKTPSRSWREKGRHTLFILIPSKTRTAFCWACQCSQKRCYTTNKSNHQAFMIIQDAFYVFSLPIYTVSLIKLNFLCLLWAFKK